MPLNKIEQAQLAGKGVCGQPDIPGLPAAQMQYKVEEIVRDVVIPAFNANVEAQLAENEDRYTKEQTDEMIGAAVEAAIEEKLADAGTGDMMAQVYDPHGLQRDIFAAIPGENLLDNSDFSDPVNQRGEQKCETANTPWLDRWLTGSNEISCEWMAEGYVKVEGSGTAFLTQRIEKERLTPGKTYTVSVWEWGTDTVHSGSAPAAGAGETNGSVILMENDVFCCTLVQSVTSQNWFFHLTCKQPQGCIHRIKLEEGDRPTAYQKTDYGQRLLECQRYYRYLPTRSCLGLATSNTTVDLTFPLVPVMRIAPSATTKHGLTVRDGSSTITVSSMDNSKTTAEQLRLTVTASGLSINRAYTNSAELFLSAEL